MLLPLDLSERAHLALLRAHLDTHESVILTEAESDRGWFDGRAHEITAPVTAVRPPQWPAVPPVTADQFLTRDHGHLPGTAPACWSSCTGTSNGSHQVRLLTPGGPARKGFSTGLCQQNQGDENQTGPARCIRHCQHVDD